MARPSGLGICLVSCFIIVFVNTHVCRPIVRNFHDVDGHDIGAEDAYVTVGTMYTIDSHIGIVGDGGMCTV
jgi:hypothetical protein